ncbi:MAG: sugar transporter [Clostridiaceae bacterium]|nr:sugar transporter [Clostridiaceae bacterium]
MDKRTSRNRFFFSVGTIGRDMQYTLVSMFLNVYLTEVLNLPDQTLWWTTGITLAVRIYDAVNDPLMGLFVDNTKTRFGKFKPWIAIGGLLSAIFTVLFFTDIGLRGTAYIISFTVIYLLWEVTFSGNDIGYWSMLPTLSIDQKTREKIGSTARICANIGLFITVVAILPVTNAIGNVTGGRKVGFFIVAVAIVLISIFTQAFTVFGVKEQRSVFKKEEKTSLRELARAIFKNDQLIFTLISLALFMIGYTTTTSFGTYFFIYAYRDEGMYSIFAAILGVSQLAALMVFPFFSKRFSRKQLYFAATILVVIGYIVFFFAPMNMLFIGAAGIPLFVGQAFIQLLMLMFLADTIEYGQWKLGRRNESITFSVQPFINKIGGAVGNAVVGAVVIMSGISAADGDPDKVSESGLLMMKSAMLIIPLILIVLGFIVYKLFFRIDKEKYDLIITDLKARGDISEDAN